MEIKLFDACIILNNILNQKIVIRDSQDIQTSQEFSSYT